MDDMMAKKNESQKDIKLYLYSAVSVQIIITFWLNMNDKILTWHVHCIYHVKASCSGAGYTHVASLA